MRFLTVAVVLLTAHSARAMPIGIDLGSAASFGVLAGSAVTNTGPTSIQGSAGVSPGLTVTGLPSGSVTGAIHAGDAAAAQAVADLGAAYGTAAGAACGVQLTGQDLGGLTLTAGSYCFSSSAQLSGTLTLDAQGDPNAVFLFQIGSTLTAASAAAVHFLNGGQGGDLFWQIGSSATLGSATDFAGTILAYSSITLNTGATIACGRALAEHGAVSLDTNAITAPSGCGGATPAGVSEPGTAAMFGGAIMLCLMASGRRRALCRGLIHRTAPHARTAYRAAA